MASGATMAQQDMDKPYSYVGVSGGRAQANVDKPQIAAAVTSAGVAHTITNSDERRTGYKVFGGYQMNRYFGVEAGYFNLGKYTFESTTVPVGSLNGQLQVEGLNLDLVGTAPLGNNFALIGRIGVQNAKTRGTFVGTGAALVADPTPSRRETNYKAGLGLQYDVSSNLQLRGEAEYYRINTAVGGKTGVNLFSLSLVFPLGQTASGTTMTYVPKAPMNSAAVPVAAPAPTSTPTSTPLVITETMPAPVVVAPAQLSPK